jgi:hypothetical protein
MINEFEYNKHTIRIIETDASEESPREYDPLGIMVTFHSNVNYNDLVPALRASDYESLEAVKAHLIEEYDPVVILPVYLYDHSGMRMSVKPFSDRFDSGQLGFIFTTREKMHKHRTFKRLTKKLRDEAEQQLIGEIETMDQWLSGEAYGFVIDPQSDDDEEGLHEEYGSAYYDAEEAEIVAKDSVDRLRAMDEELELIEALPEEELPKYINHKWKYPHVAGKAYKERLKWNN